MAKPASDLCAERALHYLQLGGLLFSGLDELVMFPEDVLPLARGEQTEVSEKPYDLHYSTDEGSWILYGTVLQLKKSTSVNSRPGEIAQIEYSLDGERSRYEWSSTGQGC